MHSDHAFPTPAAPITKLLQAASARCTFPKQHRLAQRHHCSPQESKQNAREQLPCSFSRRTLKNRYNTPTMVQLCQRQANQGVAKSSTPACRAAKQLVILFRKAVRVCCATAVHTWLSCSLAPATPALRIHSIHIAATA